MAIRVEEDFNSRKLTTGTNAVLDLLYYIHGTEDENEAKNAVLEAAPENYGSNDDPPLLYRKSVQLELHAPNCFQATVHYDGTIVAGETPLDAEDTFEFDTGGGTQHITQSLETVAVHADNDEDAVDFQGAIGVSNNAVDGADIVVPVYNFSEAHKKPVVNLAYRLALLNATGKVNSAKFRGFEAGEVLFLGAAGKKTGKYSAAPWELTFKFAVQKNRVGFSLGGFTGITKKGWEYLWVRYSAQEDETLGERIKRPIAIYIEKVYEETSFSALGI